MSKKKTIEHYDKLAQEREHELISVDNPETPSQGKLTIKCTKCNNTFTTTAHSYQNARQSGCPECKRVSTSTQWAGKPRTVTPEQARKKAVVNAAKKAAYLKKAERYSSFKSREDLISHLKSENNEYSAFILERMDNPPQGDDVEQHHVIPLHAGGPDQPWNFIPLTSEDHLKAHEIRAEVYKEIGDINAIRLRGENNVELRTRRIEANKRGDATRKSQGTGIYEEGASVKGGQIGGKVKSIAKDLGHRSQTSSAVIACHEEGSTWFHKPTGTVFRCEPNEVRTLPQLVEKLIEALPEGAHKENLAAGKMTPVTSSLARVIKRDRSQAYGWEYHPYT
jgi:hypothetical protein